MKKLLLVALCLLASLVFWAGGAWGVPHYCVDPGGGGDYTDLQAALNYVQENGAGVIMVVHGTYTGHFTYNSDDGYNITLLGGYTAGCAGRVVDPSLTTLDGAHTGRVLLLSNTSGGNIQVDGFTIQNGSAPAGYGGGVFAYTYSDSGTGSDITLANNTITGNNAPSAGGGGVWAGTESNSGVAGNIALLNNTITGNTATSGSGGGVFANSYSESGTAGAVTLLNNTVTGNSATGGFGGGVNAYTLSGVGTAGVGAIIFTNNTIQGNSASGGGGVWAYTYSNSGTAGTVTLTNNTIAGNNASSGDGGVYAYSASNSGTGGTVTFTNNTITGNTAGSFAGGLDLYKAGNTINCYNNICWGNTAPTGGDIKITGTGTVNGYNNDYTNMYGSWDNADSSNINADPLFVDATTGDYHLRPASPCIDTGNNTPLDGLPSTDFEGDARVIDGNNDGTATVDIGADEYNGEVLSACVATAGELQAALTAAEANYRNDLIMVVQGTYSGHFTYASTDGFSITLQGGYTAGCAGRVVNPANTTILDGGGSGGRVLTITINSNSGGGNIQVDGFTIQNGVSPDVGGGVFASSASDTGTAGTVTIANNIIQDNSAAHEGGGGFADSWSDNGTAGTITITNNIIQENISATNDGGGVYAESWSDNGTAGTITITNNIIQDNSAALKGGGVDAESGSIAGTAGTVTVTNNTVSGNTAGAGGGTYLMTSGASGGMVNAYNNIVWGNTAPTGGDVYLNKGTGVAYAYNNDFSTPAGSSWDNSDSSNVNTDPLFVNSGSGDYHLQGLSPCIDVGLNSAPGIPAQDFEGDTRIIDGDNNGTATVDMGADEFSVLPADGTIFAGCSLISKYQPFFQWTGLVRPFKSFTIFFSTSDNDFSTKGVFITKANIKGTKSSYLPSSGVWKKLFTAAWNGGTIRNIYWKVIGTRADKSTVSSAVWSFSVDASYPPEIIAPTEGATLSAAALPTFTFDTACNIKFRLEISSDISFGDKKKIKAFSYSVKDPNITTSFSKMFSSGQWKSVQKLIGTNTGYFRIKAWDVIKREADSATQSFTITP